MNRKSALGVFIVALLTILGVMGAATAQATGGGHDPVTFCHNGHTITTDDDGQIQGHLKHVYQGKDTLGPCPTSTPTSTATPTPTSTPTETPTEEPTIEPSPTSEPSETPTVTPTQTPSESPSPTSTVTSTETPTTTPSSTPSPVTTSPTSGTSEVGTVAELAATGVPAWILIVAAVALIAAGLAMLALRASSQYNMLPPRHAKNQK